MKRILLIALVFCVGLLGLTPSRVEARDIACENAFTLSSFPFPKVVYDNVPFTPIPVSFSDMKPNHNYRFKAFCDIPTVGDNAMSGTRDYDTDANGNLQFDIIDTDYFNLRVDAINPDNNCARVSSGPLTTDNERMLYNNTAKAYLRVENEDQDKCELLRYDVRPEPAALTCEVRFSQENGTGCMEKGPEVLVEVVARYKDNLGSKVDGQLYSGSKGSWRIDTDPHIGGRDLSVRNGIGVITIPSDDFKTGEKMNVEVKFDSKQDGYVCKGYSPVFKENCNNREPITPLDPDNPPTDIPEDFRENLDYNFCMQIPDRMHDAKDRCETCFQENKIYTAIGCISFEDQGLGAVKALSTVGLGMAGGTSLLMGLVAAFKISYGQGEPKQLSDAKEMLGSAGVGILFVIFSVVILQFIGVNLLQIPGFGG